MITKKNIIDFIGVFTDTAEVKVIDADGNVIDIEDITYASYKNAAGDDKFVIALKINKSYTKPKPPQVDLNSIKAIRGAINIWTDGSCSGNPGTGGWAYVVKCVDKLVILNDSGRVHIETTNNRMELMAAIKAMQAVLADKSLHVGTVTPIVITTDSEYMVNLMTDKSKPNTNFDLIGTLKELCKDLNITWNWQRRNSCYELEMCDDLSNRASTTANYKHINMVVK